MIEITTLVLERREICQRGLSPLLFVVSVRNNVQDENHASMDKATGRLLLKSGTNLYARDSLGKTMAHYCFLWGQRLLILLCSWIS